MSVEKVKVNNISLVWNRSCEIEDGDIYDFVFCETKKRVLFVKKGCEYNPDGLYEDDNLVRDEVGCLVWADQSDYDHNYVMSVFPYEVDQDDNRS